VAFWFFTVNISKQGSNIKKRLMIIINRGISNGEIFGPPGI
jgi:hypothetical protein